MNLSTTLLFYLLLGTAVAVAAFLVPGVATGRERCFRALTALVFWPLYLPILLSSVATRRDDSVSEGGAMFAAPRGGGPDDDVTRAIRQVEVELDVALGSLGGWSDAVLAREKHRFAELRAAWRAQADKIHELDRLLAQPAFSESEGTPESPERAANCERARRANIDRLRNVRGQMHADLLNTLAWVRELVTMIHLAKYTGAPASRAEELVMQIATSVKGLSKVEASNVAGTLRVP